MFWAIVRFTQGEFAAGEDEIEVSVTPLDELVRRSERVDLIKDPRGGG